MKKIMLLFVISLLWAGTYAQEYYYYKGEKQYLTLDKTRLNITTSPHFQKEQMRSTDFEILNITDLTHRNLMFGSVKLQSEIKNNEYEEIINLLRSNNDVIAVHPNFITARGVPIGMSPYFYVRLKDVLDYDILKKIAEQKNVVIVEQNKFLPLWYTLICTRETQENTLSVANYFFETGLFSSSVPDFLSDDVLCTNDPNFSQLWGLRNTTYPNIDVNACSAWNITRGNGITVAVLDVGIELTHIDLKTNISSFSYNTESNSSPSQTFGDHGTHCAGTIGAIRNNNTQVVGVAPECKLMSVSNSLAATPNSRIKRADGINWAWRNGADIISNSWSSSVQYDVIDEAISNALMYGRNGKGTLVVFASGNDYGAVSYPANSNPDIIAVGAISVNGARASFSNYGTTLDVVAPGDNILSTVLYNGMGTMSGTSMATPHVAGVAALVLSVNPNLTAQQVRDIIESTAQKVGGYTYQSTTNRPNGTWNNQMGYGLVNAYAAVQKSQCTVNLFSQTITANRTVTSCGDINVQDVTVKSGATLILDADASTRINGGFKVELGAGLRIQ
ncbi:MAG: S8 family serine peptidase [Bacteroidales bacterium]|jgi:subtilisin family serine protease|nr:S8 family serine peptidase [Bacteroidales bacterium]